MLRDSSVDVVSPGEAEEIFADFYSCALSNDAADPCFKAATEGDERFVYTRPSNQNWDRQREKIPEKALIESAEYFLDYGNIDILHLSHTGLKQIPPIESPWIYEIGKPVKVHTEPYLVVKARIYSGEGPAAEQANKFWNSIEIGQTWFPSVGGIPTAPKVFTPHGCIIPHLRWTNIGFAKRSEVVNPCVHAVQLEPFFKAVTAGYATDVSGMTGGQATQLQSIQGHPQHEERSFKALGLKYLTGSCEHRRGRPSLAGLVDHFRSCAGLPEHTARAYAARLLGDVAARIKSKRNEAAAQAA